MAQRDIIAIGGSLGAIDAVKQLCGSLPPDLAAAIFIVIHVGAKGNNLLASIFGEHSAIPVSTAVDGETFERGRAYVAPANHHLLVIDDVVRLGNGPRENMARPAIDPLFRSVAIAHGPRAIGVVLTGMLNDGAAGLADVKRCGGITIVQDPSDSLAPQMPMGALRASAVDYRAPAGELGALLTKLVVEEAGPMAEIPRDIALEVDIALGPSCDTGMIAKLADPVPLSCPACSGVLSQVKQGPSLRFRCQIGHGYTDEALAAEQDRTADEAIGVALRIIEERVVLSAKMAEDARRSGRNAAAVGYEQRGRELTKYIEALRRATAKK